ncbi:MAG: DUF4872 domain-containing protein, partial [Chloroflexi bacterium]|nr:DUF4872 domain-containing protein [Chloroflexota bacterium]
GGCFRYMFSRFLGEAAQITGDERLIASAEAFQRIGDQWEELGEWFRQTFEAPDPAARLGECVSMFRTLADLEEAAWQRLQELVEG